MRNRLLLFASVIMAPLLLAIGLSYFIDTSEPPPSHANPTSENSLGIVEVYIGETSFWLPNIPFLSLLGPEAPDRARRYGRVPVARGMYTFENGEEFSWMPYTTKPPYYATRFIFTRGASWNTRTAFDALLDERSPEQSLALTTFLSIRDSGPATPIALDFSQPTSIRGFARTNLSDQNILRDNEILHFNAISNEILLFGNPIQMNCLGLRLSNDPYGINCRIYGTMRQGFLITVDIRIDEATEDAWPPLEDAWSDWPARFTALENVITSFMSQP